MSNNQRKRAKKARRNKRKSKGASKVQVRTLNRSELVMEIDSSEVSVTETMRLDVSNPEQVAAEMREALPAMCGVGRGLAEDMLHFGDRKWVPTLEDMMRWDVELKSILAIRGTVETARWDGAPKSDRDAAQRLLISVYGNHLGVCDACAAAMAP